MGVRDPILKKYENWYAELEDFEVPNTIQFFRCELRAIASLRGNGGADGFAYEKACLAS